MKKKHDDRKKPIIINYLNTKFDGKELVEWTSPYNTNFKIYYLGDTPIIDVYLRGDGFRGTYHQDFLWEFSNWFPKFKYKRRHLHEWFMEKYNPKLPEGCTIYVP